MRTIETEIEIDAPAERIWQALTAGRERAWDPLFTSFEGALARDAKLVVRMRKGPALTMRVTAFEPAQVLEWKGGIRGLIGGRHRFELVPKGERVLFKHSESFSGLLVGLLGGLLGKVAAQYRAFNLALKAEAEKS
jgi:hypothetical protein